MTIFVGQSKFMTDRRATVLGGLAFAAAFGWAKGTSATMALPESDRSRDVRTRVAPKLVRQLGAQNLSLGAPLCVRIFKAERRLELWLEPAPGAAYLHFKTFRICAYSGRLGPKLKEGDNQAPEGFYRVAARQLNPASRYHLSFNLGFPNRYDRAHGRSGSYLMVHGSCVSIGCYAMTDRSIEEIYVLLEAALRAGVPDVPVHIFPFEMSAANLARAARSRWASFWRELEPGYRLFEQNRRPPEITVVGRHYRVAA